MRFQSEIFSCFMCDSFILDMNYAFKVIYAIFEAHYINFGIIMAASILKVNLKLAKFEFSEILVFFLLNCFDWELIVLNERVQ